MTSNLLDQKVALVVGASRGIGAEVARALGRHGAAVAVNYFRSADAAKQVVADIESAGSRAVAFAGDAANAEDMSEMVAAAADALGGIDILVCNAVGDTNGGFERVQRGLANALDNADAITRQVSTQLAMTLYPCREAVPHMRNRGGGSIIMIGATTSRGRPAPGVAEISVAKAAQEALARSLAGELGSDRIRVNVIAPGMVPTDANAGPFQEEMIKRMAAVTPLGRVASTADVAGAVVALSADLTSHVTGAFIGVDGGRHMP